MNPSARNREDAPRSGFGRTNVRTEPARVAVCVMLALLLGACSTGCQRELMASPNLYVYGNDDAFDRVPEAYRNNKIDVLYVTDRIPSEDSEDGPDYGYGRSHSLAYGSCIVEIGDDLSWEDLRQASLTNQRKISIPLQMEHVNELGRFPPVPFPVVEKGPRPVEDPVVLAEVEASVAAFHDELSARLSRSDHKHVYIYIHGFANTFEDAVFRTAELWHFLGRQGVPLCYTWPSGRGLSGRGYVYDSVSCEFTIYHLKQLLRTLGRAQDVEKVHILAHSRGTEVTTAALRELQIEHTHASVSAREALKLGNVVLAAPDLDFDVVQQRLGGERVGFLPECVTIYTSPADRALALADFLTLGVTRLGQLQPSNLTPRLRQMVETSPITFVEALVDTGFLGHSYYLNSPAVSSDVILVLRDERSPGTENGRPLTERMTNFYELRDDYLKNEQSPDKR